MAGHSKWHNIKHRKAAQDAKKSKIYAQAGKMIQLAAKSGSDPSLNPALETALVKARQVGLPKDVIQKAIDKGAGNISGEELVEVYYEGYAPGGVALYMKSITSNTNRSSAMIKALLSKYGGNIGEPGSVSRQFLEKGEIFITGKIHQETVKGIIKQTVLPLDIHACEEDIIESGAENYEFDDTIVRILTAKESFSTVLDYLQERGWHIDESSLAYIPENPISIDGETEEKLERLLGLLDDEDDIDTVWHNAA